jgi:hypothetical protein
MTRQHAEELVRHHQEVISDESVRGARRNPSLLPAPKSELIRSIKLAIAELYQIGADDEGRIEPLLRAAMMLDNFTHSAVGATEFVGAMVKRRKEMDQFREQLASIARDHPFFWQQVYSLAGIEEPTRSATLYERVKLRLRNRTSHSSSSKSQPKSTYDYVSSRHDLTSS